MTAATDSDVKQIQMVVGEEATDLILHIMSRITKELDYCFDPREPFLRAGNTPLWNAVIQLKKRGVRLRFIIDVTQETISNCKEIIRYAEVGHIDSIKANFGIVDGMEYLSYVTDANKQFAKQLLYVNVDSFVATQQYLFDYLWSKSVPAKEKVREIEKGMIRDFIETIQEPQQTQKLALDIINSSMDEVLILFPTVNALRRAENQGLLELLGKARERGVNVRILIHVNDDKTREMTQKKFNEKNFKINMQYITKDLQTTMTTMVVDQAVCLSIEVNDETKENFEDTTGLATYSNSESTVSSCISIFETLWIQSELDKQNKIKQVYFQLFKGFKLKDETYRRQWFSERRTKQMQAKE